MRFVEGTDCFHESNQLCLVMVALPFAACCHSIACLNQHDRRMGSRKKKYKAILTGVKCFCQLVMTMKPDLVVLLPGQDMQFHFAIWLSIYTFWFPSPLFTFFFREKLSIKIE